MSSSSSFSPFSIFSNRHARTSFSHNPSMPPIQEAYFPGQGGHNHLSPHHAQYYQTTYDVSTYDPMSSNGSLDRYSYHGKVSYGAPWYPHSVYPASNHHDWHDRSPFPAASQLRPGTETSRDGTQCLEVGENATIEGFGSVSTGNTVIGANVNPTGNTPVQVTRIGKGAVIRCGPEQAGFNSNNSVSFNKSLDSVTHGSSGEPSHQSSLEPQPMASRSSKTRSRRRVQTGAGRW
jgi:hypothetical protein